MNKNRNKTRKLKRKTQKLSIKLHNFREKKKKKLRRSIQYRKTKSGKKYTSWTQRAKMYRKNKLTSKSKKDENKNEF